MITTLGQGASQSVSQAVTINGSAASGDLVVLYIGSDFGTSPAFTISDSSGGSNTWTQDEGFASVAGSGGLRNDMYRSVLSASITSVTVTPNAGTRVALYVWKIQTPSGSPPGDNMGTKEGAGRSTTGSTTISSNLQTWTTTNANDDIIIGVSSPSSTTLTGVTGGWTAESTASVATDLGLTVWGFHGELTSAGSQSIGGTLGASVQWCLIGGQYKYTSAVFVAAPLKTNLVAVNRGANW